MWGNNDLKHNFYGYERFPSQITNGTEEIRASEARTAPLRAAPLRAVPRRVVRNGQERKCDPRVRLRTKNKRGLPFPFPFPNILRAADVPRMLPAPFAPARAPIERQLPSARSCDRRTADAVVVAVAAAAAAASNRCTWSLATWPRLTATLGRAAERDRPWGLGGWSSRPEQRVEAPTNSENSRASALCNRSRQPLP